jgi:hypothetical protein
MKRIKAVAFGLMLMMTGVVYAAESGAGQSTPP